MLDLKYTLEEVVEHLIFPVKPVAFQSEVLNINMYRMALFILP